MIDASPESQGLVFRRLPYMSNPPPPPPPPPIRQTLVVCRVITPREYDEAAQRHPNCCPLVMMGDRRSGQQLLDCAGEDLEQTMESLASSPEGRAQLDCLAEHLELQLQAMEPERPPPVVR